MSVTNWSILSNGGKEWVLLGHSESTFGEAGGMAAKPELLTT